MSNDFTYFHNLMFFKTAIVPITAFLPKKCIDQIGHPTRLKVTSINNLKLTIFSL